MIPRLLEKIVKEKLSAYDKIILIMGARQVGKTTLLKNLRDKLLKEKKTVLYLNCDVEEERRVIDSTSLAILSRLTLGTDFLFIDEAQRLSDPGLTIKIIYDNLKGVRVVATGSSSFDLKNKMSDALTGRYLDYFLYPLSFIEALDNISQENEAVRKNMAYSLLDQVLLFGFYPEIYLAKRAEDKTLFLEKIVESYLFKDILSFQKVRNPKAIMDLTRALAYQIGSEINENELAMRLKIDRKTVISYLDILEKSFVILRVYPYSRNPRREIGRNYKIYFVDLGIRNSLIGDFNSFNIRADSGFLWENFLFMERIKAYGNSGRKALYYFWRKYGGAEVDYIEKRGEKFEAFEFKYRGSSLSRGANIFSKEYNTEVRAVNKENFLDFLEVKSSSRNRIWLTSPSLFRDW